MQTTRNIGRLDGKGGWTMLEFCAMGTGVMLALIGLRGAYQDRAMRAAQEVQLQFMPTIGSDVGGTAPTAEPLLNF